MNLEYLDEFVDEHYDEIYEGLDGIYRGELFPNDEVTLDDIDEEYITEYIENNMEEEYQNFCDSKMHLVTMDDKCKEILALQLKKGDATHQTRSSLLASAEAAIVNTSYDKLVSLLKEQPFYKFNVDKVLSRITEDNPVSQVVAPVIISRMDADGIGKHILLETLPQQGDEVIHTLPLDPDNLQDLLSKCEKLGLETGGINALGDRPDAPTTIIYGKKGTIAEHKEALMKTYEANR